MHDMDSSNFDGQAESILLDCDTEFIHFSETLDQHEAGAEESFVELSNYQPTSSHQQYAAQLQLLKTNSSVVAVDQQQPATATHTSSIVAPLPELTFFELSENEDQFAIFEDPIGIKIRDILKVTGTFDAKKFNKLFEEDTIKLCKQQIQDGLKRRLESQSEVASVNRVVSVPVSSSFVTKLLRSRRAVNKPMSEWFLKQLLLMTSEFDEVETKQLEGKTLTALLALARERNIPEHFSFHVFDEDHNSDSSVTEVVMEEHTQVTMLGETFLDDITNDVNNSDLELQQIVPYGRYLDVEDEIVPHNNKQDDCPHITHHDATTTAVSLMLDPAPASDSMNPSPAPSSSTDSGIQSPSPPAQDDLERQMMIIHAQDEQVDITSELRGSSNTFIDTENHAHAASLLSINEGAAIKRRMITRNKKELRMIRNREAAINSRRKKKEYLSRLETQIQNLTTLATNLSEENRQLKTMIIETGVDKL